jgi:uncharacterized protein
MKSVLLTIQQARNIHLYALGLLNPPEKPATKSDVLQKIKDMSVLQIDTISVINRSPYLVLWSRIGDFDIRWVEELLHERALFEYWSHEACFLPIEDYPLYRALILSKKARAFHWSKEWITANKKDANRVLEYVKINGPTMSAHFTKIKRQKEGWPASNGFGVANAGWWNWKVEKMALDMLYTQGKLTIVGRKNFHRIYDITENAIAEEYLNQKLKVSDVYMELVERTVKHLGIVKRSWVPDYFRIKKTVCYPIFDKLIKKKKLVPIDVEGFTEKLYMHVDSMRLVQSAVNGKLTPSHTTFLSPFDPLVWDRKRTLELFNFDYRIECYTPAPKRIYGYFTLPILYKGEIIGRMDAKAHRKEGVFEVKALHFEKWFAPDEECFDELSNVLQKFANWHKTPKVRIKSVFPSRNLSSFKSSLRKQNGKNS